jgi:eukaryotic-like serine/threonine-protein kinase
MVHTEGIPERIGDYKILNHLSRRDGVELLLAKEDGPAGFERNVVLKIVAETNAKNKVDELSREAAATSRLRHPSIQRLFRFFEFEERLVLVLEWLDGVELGEVLTWLRRQRRTLPDECVFYIAHALSSALAHAHASVDEHDIGTPVIHRGLRPDVVMVGWDSSISLTGFGLSKILGTSPDTAFGLSKSNPGYMAPEQLRGEQTTKRVDVFQLGLVIWEMLAGKPAMGHGALGQSEQVARVVAGEKLPSIGTIRPNLRPELVAVVDASLEPDVQRRTLACAELESWLSSMANLPEGKDKLREILKEFRSAEYVRPGALLGEPGTGSKHSVLPRVRGAKTSSKFQGPGAYAVSTPSRAKRKSIQAPSKPRSSLDWDIPSAAPTFSPNSSDMFSADGSEDDLDWDDVLTSAQTPNTSSFESSADEEAVSDTTSKFHREQKFVQERLVELSKEKADDSLPALKTPNRSARSRTGSTSHLYNPPKGAMEALENVKVGGPPTPGPPLVDLGASKSGIVAGPPIPGPVPSSSTSNPILLDPPIPGPNPSGSVPALADPPLAAGSLLEPAGMKFSLEPDGGSAGNGEFVYGRPTPIINEESVSQLAVVGDAQVQTNSRAKQRKWMLVAGTVGAALTVVVIAMAIKVVGKPSGPSAAGQSHDEKPAMTSKKEAKPEDVTQAAATKKSESLASPNPASKPTPVASETDAPVSIPMGYGLIKFRSYHEGDLYINGHKIGELDHPLLLRCGHHFVRVGKITKPNIGIRWVSAGTSVYVVCGQRSTATLP